MTAEVTTAEREQAANRWARLTAVVVLLVGGVLVVAPAVVSIGEVFDATFEPRTTTKTVVTISGDQTTTQTTTSEAEASFLERALAEGGLVLLRIGIVALAAFLAGAVVQRTIVADFALKVGPVEVPARATAAVSEAAFQDVETALNRQAEATLDALDASASAVESVSALAERVAALEGSQSGKG